MACYVYILKSTVDGRLYIGSAQDPDLRLASHNSGKVRSTKAYRPWHRIWLEPFESRSKALQREKYLKSGYGRRWLDRNVLSRASREAG